MGFSRRIESSITLAAQLAALVQQRQPEFVLVAEPTYCNVCFWYVPPSMRTAALVEALQRRAVASSPAALPHSSLAGCAFGLQDWLASASCRDALRAATESIAARVNRAGKLMIDFSPIACKQLPSFFRAITSNRMLRENHLSVILDEIGATGAELFPLSSVESP